MAYLDNDGLYRKYGPEKTIPAKAGDYVSYGDTRLVEVEIDLTTLTTTPLIIDDNTFFGTNMFIESVTVDSEVSATGGTSLSVGLMGLNRSSTISDTAFLSAAPIADHTTAGQKKEYTIGVTGVGAYVGSTSASVGYISAKAAGTYTAGKVKVRIRYRGIGTITH